MIDDEEEIAFSKRLYKWLPSFSNSCLEKVRKAVNEEYYQRFNPKD